MNPFRGRAEPRGGLRDPGVPGTEKRTKRVRAIVGFALGVLLLTAAVWAVLRQGGTLGPVWAALRAAPFGVLVGVLVLPVFSTIATAGAFRALTSRYRDVPIGEMTALIATSGLLNYLPLRPGMFGRIAYHRAVHGIAVRDSIRVVLEAMAVSAVALAALLTCAWVSTRAPGAWIWLGLPLAGAAALGAACRGTETGRWARALAWRYADMAAWASRYALAFAAIGGPLGLIDTMILTIASQAAMTIPISGNGLGVREWAVGVVAALLGPAEDGVLTRALTAELVNRAAEVAVLAPLGLACSAWVGRKLTGNKATPSPPRAQAGG